MARNTVYYSIIEKPDCFEYHCSSNRRDVVEQNALSKKVYKFYAGYLNIVDDWREEIKNMGNIMQEV